MKIEILNINENNISLYSSENNWRGSYTNSESDRETLKFILNKNECSDLWETDILPVWGENPTVDIVFEKPVDISILRKNKQIEIKNLCHDNIVKGIDIDLGLTDEKGNLLGSLHYTLSEKNQTDMRDLVGMIQSGMTEVTWRDDSRVTHMVYTAEQFMNLYQASSAYILQCRFRSDGLEALLFSYTDEEVDKIKALNWDTELPKDIEDNMNNLLGIMLNQNNTEENL